MKNIIMISVIALGLNGCATMQKPDTPFYSFAQERKLSSAVRLLEEGNALAATKLLTEITNEKGVPGVTDEALFRLTLLNIRPDMEQNGFSQAHKRLERLQKEYPSSSWARTAWPLMEFLENAEEVRRQNRNLKNVNQSLTKENKELHQNIKELNQNIKELNQNIERLKNLDLELEQKTKQK
ncbi:MAG: hypothetical protein FD174_1524 [Geobacteraceae bacterium]|nr:MAG: hypothetical protein FD174_1524 [Geobacteraceae bacterium]